MADRPTQADRRSRTRGALLESAARELSRYGYGNLVLERVAREAGYTRGALYHLFKDKQELTLAALEWVLSTWDDEVGVLVEGLGPREALLTLARGHAVFCRRDVARVAIALRVEFAGQDHPVGQAVELAYEELVGVCQSYLEDGRRDGSIPPGPSPRTTALALVGALEGTAIAMAGNAPDDALMAVRVVTGVLGLPVDSATLS